MGPETAAKLVVIEATGAERDCETPEPTSSKTIYCEGANVDIDFHSIYDKIIVSESLHGGER